MELQLPRDLTSLLGPELHSVAWVLTYSLHAAVWALVAALLSRWQSLSAARRHTAWQTALLAPFLTTWLSFAAVGALAGEPPATAARPLVTAVTLRDAIAPDVQPLPKAAASLQLDESSARRLARALDLVGAVAVAAAGLGLLRLGASTLQAHRRLRRRRKLDEGAVFAAFQRACVRSALPHVTLSQSANVDSPLVLGRAEICVPAIGLSGLTDAGLEAVFAHELAHLERGDGVWFPVVALLEALLWLHPITRRVCAEVRQSAELACDARAVELTGEPRALALALTHIASRAVAKRAVALPTMAHPGRGLVARVARLTSAPSPGSRAQRAGRTGPVLALALVAVVSVGVNLRVADARPTNAHAGRRTDVAKLSRQMSELGAQELALEAELGSSSSATDRASESEASARMLDIEQELRHTRATQQWLEGQLVDE